MQAKTSVRFTNVQLNLGQRFALYNTFKPPNGLDWCRFYNWTGVQSKIVIQQLSVHCLMMLLLFVGFEFDPGPRVMK